MVATPPALASAGTGIRNLGLDLAREIKAGKGPKLINLFLTHTHWDHIQGLPFFTPAFMKGIKIVIYGSPSREKLLQNILEGQMDRHYFPVEMSMFHADLDIKEISKESMTIGDLTIEWQEQVFHPGGCVRYRFTTGTRKFVFASDVELDQMYAPPKNWDEDPMWGDIGLDERKRLATEFSEFVEGAELLIGDGQYVAQDYPARVGWGHTSIPMLAQVAHRAQVKQLAVFHHDPDSTDKIVDECQRGFNQAYSSRSPGMSIFWAREGLTIAV
jgi:ribonuclease BN (tRNA processing enzyme)